MDAYPSSPSLFSHRKSSTKKTQRKALPITRPRACMRPCPSRSTDLQSSWILSSRPTNHSAGRGQAWKILTQQRLLGIPAAKQNALHPLADSQRLKRSHADSGWKYRPDLEEAASSDRYPSLACGAVSHPLTAYNCIKGHLHDVCS